MAGKEAGDPVQKLDKLRPGSLPFEAGVELLERRKGPGAPPAARPNGT